MNPAAGRGLPALPTAAGPSMGSCRSFVHSAARFAEIVSFVPGGTWFWFWDDTPAINGWAIFDNTPTGMPLFQFGRRGLAFGNSPAIYGWGTVHENKIKSRRDERESIQNRSLE